MPQEVILQRIDYDQLTKIQKIALLMIVLGVDAASTLLQYFEDTDIELICREITNFEILDDEIQAKVLKEFAEIIGASFEAITGGAAFAGEALRKAKGEFMAANLLGRISPIGTSLEIIKEISEMEPRQIYNLIRHEQNQTIAFVISYLNIDKAQNVIRMIPIESREDILERIGSMDETSLDNIERVVHSLRQHFSVKQKQTLHRSGGVRAVAEMLNAMDKSESKQLLNALDERNAQLASLVRRKMFSFNDLVRLSGMDLQRICREIDMNDLMVAMKNANAALQEAIFSSLSRRAAETLKEEMDMMGPVRLKEVEAAQDRIIQVVRRLEEEGEVTIEKGESGRVMV